MPPRFKKFIRKLERKQRNRVKLAIAAILSNNLKGLDIKSLKGHSGWYRCRVGTIRIIFTKTPGGKNTIHDITHRGQAYKK